MYHGDIRLGATIDIKFFTGDLGATVGATAASIGIGTALAGTPVIAAYPGNSTTEITAGITLTTGFDSRTALSNVRVVATSGNGYAAGTDYALVFTAGTVDGISVVGMVAGSFSIENRSALMPTVAARTLDVSADGEAGVDWANVGTPNSTVNLSATTTNLVNTLTTYTGNTVQTGDSFARIGATGSGLTTLATQASVNTIDDFLDTEVAAILAGTGDIQTRLPAALAGGRIDASVGAMAANTMTASALAADAVTEIQSGLSTLSAAQVNAEVLDVMTVDTFAEASSVPAATSTLKDKINWLFALARNKLTQTSTTQTLRNDADSGSIATAAVADDGTTASRNEWA